MQLMDIKCVKFLVIIHLQSIFNMRGRYITLDTNNSFSLRVKHVVKILNEIDGITFKRLGKKTFNVITKVKNVINNTEASNWHNYKGY